MDNVWQTSLWFHRINSPQGSRGSAWAHAGILWEGSFAMCSWTPSTAREHLMLWEQHCPALSSGREVPFPERARTPAEALLQECAGAGGRGCTQRPEPSVSSNPGAAPACGDTAVSLPKGWLEMNCGDGDKSWESRWERVSLNSLWPSPFSWPISTSPVAGACEQHTGIATKRPYLLHTAHCILPIRCVSRCTRNPAAFLARFCFQQYSLQGWCIHNEFHNSGHGITAPGSAGKERLLQHTVLGEPTGCEIALLEMLAQDKNSWNINTLWKATKSVSRKLKLQRCW